jgi:hypothetical protein
MAIVYNWPSSATLAGARDVSRINRAAGQEDLGFKVERLVSGLNTVQNQVSFITVALAQMMACAVSFASALSTADLTSAGASNTSTGTTVSNFRS